MSGSPSRWKTKCMRPKRQFEKVWTIEFLVLLFNHKSVSQKQRRKGPTDPREQWRAVRYCERTRFPCIHLCIMQAGRNTRISSSLCEVTCKVVAFFLTWNKNIRHCKKEKADAVRNWQAWHYWSKHLYKDEATMLLLNMWATWSGIWKEFICCIWEGPKNSKIEVTA